MNNPPSKNKHQLPVTLVFNWKVKPGKEHQFEKWAHEVTTAAERFEGHMGAIWIKPGANSQNYTLIYKFDTHDHYRDWERSDTRHEFLEQVYELTDQEKPDKIRELSGLESWFTLPNTMTIKPPPKWKMLIATIIGVFPVVLLVQVTLMPWTQDIPVILRALLMALILPTILTYLVMPNITKVFNNWLYPKK